MIEGYELISVRVFLMYGIGLIKSIDEGIRVLVLIEVSWIMVEEEGAEEEDEAALADEAVVAAWAAASLPLLSLPRPGPAPVRWTMRLALSANSKELFKKESEYLKPVLN